MDRLLNYSSAINRQVFKKQYDIVIAEQFANCMDLQLSKSFFDFTNLKPTKQISFSWVSHTELDYKKSAVSSFNSLIYINHNWNPVTICWKSKSGRIYDMGDTDIDCNDIEFWYEGLDPLLYHKQLYPKDELPFKLKNLSYALVIHRLNIDASITIKLLENDNADVKKLSNDIANFIAAFNAKAEKNKPCSGVVHQAKMTIENLLTLALEIDTGFAGPAFLKKFLPFLSATGMVEQVEIG